MTHEEKINYLRIASGLCMLSIDMKHLDLLVSLYEGVTSKEGAFSLEDAIQIELEVKDRERKRYVSETLDKVSKKVGETSNPKQPKNKK